MAAADERSWLIAQLADERAAQDHVRKHTVWQAMTMPAVLALSVVYFGVGANSYGLAFFLPQIVKAFGLTNLHTGFVSAVPFLIGTIGMVWWGRQSDRLRERRMHAALALAVAGLGMLAAAAFTDPAVRLIALCVASLGTFSSLPVFWALPTAFLSGAAAAAGIGWINAISQLGGFVGPDVLGRVRGANAGDNSLAFLLLAATALAVTFLTWVLSRPQARPN